MSTKQELYEDWKPLIEWEQDVREIDICQLNEENYVVQVANGVAGESAGGPSDPGYSEPLTKKARWDHLTDDDDDVS